MRGGGGKRGRRGLCPVVSGLLLALVVTGCAGAGEDGGDPPDATNGTIPGQGVQSDTSPADASLTGSSDTADASAADAAPGGPVSADSSPSSPTGVPRADSTVLDVGADAADSTERAIGGRTYFVRLRQGSDPEAVARRHGLEILDVTREPVPVIYVSLTPEDRAALRADSSVVSISLEIHQGDTMAHPPIRGVPTPDTSGH